MSKYSEKYSKEIQMACKMLSDYYTIKDTFRSLPNNAELKSKVKSELDKLYNIIDNKVAYIYNIDSPKHYTEFSVESLFTLEIYYNDDTNDIDIGVITVEETFARPNFHFKEIDSLSEDLATVAHEYVVERLISIPDVAIEFYSILKPLQTMLLEYL